MSKVVVTRITRGSYTFGGQVPPATKPAPRCPHCGAVLINPRPMPHRKRTEMRMTFEEAKRKAKYGRYSHYRQQMKDAGRGHLLR